MVGMIIQVIGAYIATITAAITLEAPRSLIFKTGYAGAIGYLVYLLLTDSMGAALATFFACSAVSLIAQYFAAQRALAKPFASKIQKMRWVFQSPYVPFLSFLWHY